MQPDNKPSISAEDILTAEFEYIAQTASQANDDRSSVVSFFIIAVGSPLAAFFSTDLTGQSGTTNQFILFAGLFFILSVIGTTTLLQLARLRSAWYESMLAMNHMKEFLIKNSDSDISGAFRWSFSTAPARFKPNSISFYQALQVSILSGLLFGAFVFFLLHSLQLQDEFLIWLSAALLGILFAGSQIYLYRRMLK